MKNLSLIVTLILALIVFSCGAKKEKTEAVVNTEIDNEIAEASIDSNANYEDIFANGMSDNTTPVDSSKMDKATVNEDPTKGVQLDPKVDEKEKLEPIKEIKTKMVKPHQVRFYIVVGSFKKYSNAQNLYSYFEKKGYKPLILPKSEGYNRVSIISYSQETEARTSIKKLRDEHHDLTFWLYKW